MTESYLARTSIAQYELSEENFLDKTQKVQ